MVYDKKISNWDEYWGWLFGFDRLEINRVNESVITMKAVISSGDTVINFYKIFQSYIHEIEKAKNDLRDLMLFKGQLAEHKKVFDQRMENTRQDIINTFKNFEVEIVLSYEGEFKTVYDKVSELVL